MNKNNNITINGVDYNAETGKPVEAAPSTAAPTKHHIRKFAATPKPKAPVKRVMDIAPVHHPAVAKAHAIQAAKTQPRTIKPSQVIKQEAIADAMARTTGHTRTQVKLPKTRSRLHRTGRIATAALAVTIVAGYLMYLNMPAISTFIAATQAGIHASYPSYSPSGYSLNGPVVYSGGQVSMQFAANAGPQNYTVTQKRSDWDSSAVLANYIQPVAGDNYTTTQANGLTIYSYDEKSAWVNGGILYTITGSAPLSSDQIQRIATSL